MNTVIIFFIIAFILFYGLEIMDKIDCFVENNLSRRKNDYKILLYGDENYIYRLSEILLSSQVEYKVIDDLLIGKNEDYSRCRCIISLSKEDLNNLMICRVALRYYDIPKMYSICNDIQNKIIYEKYGIHTMDIKEICSQEFITAIGEKLKNE